MKNTVTVELRAPLGNYVIELPLEADAFERCMTEASILTGARGEYEVVSVRPTLLSLNAMLMAARDIHELNYLAVKLQDFDETEASRFSDIHTALGGGMHNAVNLARYYDELALYDNINDLYELGSAYIASKLDSDTSRYTDFAVIELGKHARSVMHGLFLEDQDMFVGFPPAFSKQRYNGHVLPYDGFDPKHTIYMERRYGIPTVKIKNGLVPVNKSIDGKACVPIRFPSGAVAVSHALERIGARSLTDHAVFWYKPHDRADSAIWSNSFGRICHIVDTLSRMSEGQIGDFYKSLGELERKYDLDAIRTYKNKSLPLDEIIYRHGLLDSYANTTEVPELGEQAIEIITVDASVPGINELHTVSMSDADKFSLPDGHKVRAYSANAYAFEIDRAITRSIEAARDGSGEKASVLDQISASREAPKPPRKAKSSDKKKEGTEI